MLEAWTDFCPILSAGRLDRITGAWEMVAQFLGALCGGTLLKISLPHT